MVRAVKQASIVELNGATAESTRAQAEPVVLISDFEKLHAHRDSAQLRLEFLHA